MCDTCKKKHMSHPRRAKHQCVEYSFTNDLTKIETLLCDVHQMNFSLYCFNEEMPICLGCNSLEGAAVDDEAKKSIIKSQHSLHQTLANTFTHYVLLLNESYYV